MKLVQNLLGVDGLDGQLFVVTHSTDALVNDYRKIIRMYRDEKEMVRAACGSSFHFDSEIEKHLIMHFPEVKEALYSRCTILVEGETEYGSFGYFAYRPYVSMTGTSWGQGTILPMSSIRTTSVLKWMS